MKPGTDNTRVYRMTFASVYPHYVTKVEKKGRTKAELHAVIQWLMGYDERALQQQIDKLRVAVQEADTKVADYKAQNSIFAGSNGTSLPDKQISDVGKQITDAQAARGTAQQHADAITTLLKSGASVEGNDDVRASPVVQGLMQSRATLQATLAEKSATLLPAHPVIKGLKAQIDQINTQIRAEARRIEKALNIRMAPQELPADLPRETRAAKVIELPRALTRNAAGKSGRSAAANGQRRRFAPR